ncbi:flagellar basal body-associated FliL family protein [Burkholderia sp. BCC0044]|uniref:flagellar basal body-associated FliL family protein n=1 Tax=Burkholderia sp. BCC0044 TaxID=2676295 RepID=UPI00158DC0B4|nr:flagellar basal body-associated FliL family protein [Burkholderia sp. BCC0044]
MKPNLMTAAIAIAVAAGVGGATAFVMTRTAGTQPVVSTQPARLPIDAGARYVPLERLIVMLRGSEGDMRPRYLVLDLVFSARGARHEKQVREHLPVLRATAYSALAGRTSAEVLRMGPIELAALLDNAYEHAYGGVDRRPFDKVMVTKVMMD